MPIETTAKPSTKSISSKEDTIANHVDTLIQLWPEKWKTLSLSEKLNVLQTVANIERTYLGIHHELIVKTDLLDEDILGNYSNANYQITIDTVHLETDDPQKVLDSTLHECYHAYQHMLVDLYLNSEEYYKELKIFRRISKYSEEFSSYQQSSTDFLDHYTYYHQAVEVDARNYAKDGTKDYYTRLEEDRTHPP